MSKRIQPMEWFLRDVVAPLLGEHWGAEWDYGRGTMNSRYPGIDYGLFGQLDELIRRIRLAAGDAQAGSLPELKKARRCLRQLSRKFDEAVEFAERKTKHYRETERKRIARRR